MEIIFWIIHDSLAIRTRSLLRTLLIWIVKCQSLESKNWVMFTLGLSGILVILIPRYYFEVMTISCKLLLSGIIIILILSWFTEESLYALSYTN